MKSEAEIKKALRDWIVRKNGKIRAEDLTGETLIIEERIITSVQIMDLILFIEHLTGQSIDVTSLKRGVFRNVDTIYQNFFAS